MNSALSLDNLLLNFKTNGNNSNGILSYFETNKDIPFEIKRIYYIYDVPLYTERGMHAHKEIQQILWCPFGSIEVILDNGDEEKSFLLDSPNKGLLVLKGHWHKMYWKKESSVLCVAASDYYYEDDYIRDYNDYCTYIEKGYWTNES